MDSHARAANRLGGPLRTGRGLAGPFPCAPGSAIAPTVLLDRHVSCRRDADNKEFDVVDAEALQVTRRNAERTYSGRPLIRAPCRRAGPGWRNLVAMIHSASRNLFERFPDQLFGCDQHRRRRRVSEEVDAEFDRAARASRLISLSSRGPVKLRTSPCIRGRARKLRVPVVPSFRFSIIEFLVFILNSRIDAG